VTPKLLIVTEIIAPYRIPVFNALAQTRKIDLHVVFLSESDPSLRQWRVYKDEINFSYEVLPSWRQRLGKYNVLINRGVVSAVEKIKPNAVLCGGYNYLACWQIAGWTRFHRIPLLLWSESTAVDNRRKHLAVEFLKSRFLDWCSAFIVPGKSSSEYLKSLRITDGRIFIAPNAVDIQLFARLAEGTRQDACRVRALCSLPQRYFVYVGRLVKAKGVFDLLEAYAQLPQETRAEVGLVFVGDGEARPELEKCASRIAPGTVQFHGFAHRDELPEFYALAEALIFPTHSDPWGLVVNEAMACGLPVISTNVAGCVADLLQDGWNGFVVPSESPSQLAAAMERLAEQTELRKEMGLRSRQRIELFSPAAWARGVVTAILAVCAREV
jgi:glycosyltransferase involved in cell wall biosynthesis